ncbi:MAG: amino acid adenylation domain-containing protein [Lachnospiraceae bacterium]|nr:amino acid adenylation domain-containing protein [Lachnospiraceae bacterium]
MQALTVLDWLEAQEKRIPEKCAVIDPEGRMTYAALAKYARCVGRALAKEDVAGGAVAIFADKTCHTFAAMLGVLYASAFYSVIDKGHPAPRARAMVETLRAKVILCDSASVEQAGERFRDMSVRLIDLTRCMRDNEPQADSRTDTAKDSRDEEQNDPLPAIREALTDSAPMYCNFTSGSTGTPKGVLIGHRSVTDFIPVFTETMGLTEQDVFGNQAPLDFDVSVKDLYSALYLGATVALIPQKYFMNPTALTGFLAAHDVSILIWAASALVVLSVMKGLSLARMERLRRIIYSGEALPKTHRMHWHEVYPDVTFVNAYGPTEITCNCTYHVLTEEDIPADDVPVGIAFRNKKVFLLDDEDRLVTESNRQGEICVAGTCLAIGYLGEAGTEAFVRNPVNDLYEERIYRTGDIGRYDDAHRLFFCGRRDFQIKHMGHRIELFEIERAAESVEGVARACCLYDEAGTKIVLAEEGVADTGRVRSALKEKLPRYMLPGVIRYVEHIPLNKNGKADRAALRRLTGMDEHA